MTLQSRLALLFEAIVQTFQRLGWRTGKLSALLPTSSKHASEAAVMDPADVPACQRSLETALRARLAVLSEAGHCRGRLDLPGGVSAVAVLRAEPADPSILGDALGLGRLCENPPVSKTSVLIVESHSDAGRRTFRCIRLTKI